MAGKKTVEVTDAQTDDEAKELIVQMLTKASLDPDASMLDRARAIDTLGRFKERSWFARPTDPQQQGNVIDQRTAELIANLAERLELTKGRHCGKNL